MHFEKKFRDVQNYTTLIKAITGAEFWDLLGDSFFLVLRRVWCIYETYVSTLEQAAHQHHGVLEYQGVNSQDETMLQIAQAIPSGKLT